MSDPSNTAQGSGIENLTNQPNHSSLNELSELENPFSASDEFKKTCYVCHEGQETNEQWVAPCKCIGSLKYVHQQCIQMWVDTQLKNSQNNKVSCPQCKTEYIVVFPSSSKFVYCLELLDKIISSVSPYLVGAIFVSSIYWSALSYGALSFLQVMGFEKGRGILESSDPVTLFVMLPSIPVILVLGKLIRWEDQYLRIWRNNHKSFPILKFLFKEPPADTGRESCEKILLGRENFTNSISSARMICSALLLPSISNLIGHYFFEDVESNLHRTLLGGLSFILVKGLFKIYLRQSQYIKHSNRHILDFTESTSSSSSSSRDDLNANVDIENADA